MDTIPFTFPEGWLVRGFRYPFNVAHPHAKLRTWLADNLEEALEFGLIDPRQCFADGSGPQMPDIDNIQPTMT